MFVTSDLLVLCKRLLCSAGDRAGMCKWGCCHPAEGPHCSSLLKGPALKQGIIILLQDDEMLPSALQVTPGSEQQAQQKT